MVSTAAFHARFRGSVPGLGGLKETKKCFFPIHCDEPPWPRGNVLGLIPGWHSYQGVSPHSPFQADTATKGSRRTAHSKPTQLPRGLAAQPIPGRHRYQGVSPHSPFQADTATKGSRRTAHSRLTQLPRGLAAQPIPGRHRYQGTFCAVKWLFVIAPADGYRVVRDGYFKRNDTIGSLIDCWACPTNTIHQPNVVLTLAHRLRRWSNI